MPELTFKALGWLVARLPESLWRLLAAGLGDLLFFCAPRRRRLLLSNLHHAFADRPAAWHRAIGRESCRRLVETGLWSLAMPFLSEARLRTMLRATPALVATLTHRKTPGSVIFAAAHLCGWESQTVLALLLPGILPEFGVIYRPLDNPAADAWVRRSRERFGMRLLSRKAGFQEALKILRRNGYVGLLFDQNAGFQGGLTTLFGRVCSTSELAGLLAEKFHSEILALFPRHLGFWRIELDLKPIAFDGSATDATLALNRWLESHLTSDDNACASWLWLHDRWRHQDMPARRLRLESKRNLLEADLRQRGWNALPRKTRLWIRLPNWLGDVVMAIPLLRAVRISRPDAHVTLLAKAHFQPLLEQAGVADRVLPLPPRGTGYFRHFYRLRSEYPDCYLLFTNSFRGDLEAWLTRSPQRFGLVRARRSRPLLTHGWRVPADFDECHHHQIKLWENYLSHFGLNAPPDFKPLRAAAPAQATTTQTIGLICGSENEPAKRWPVENWRVLIAQIATQYPAVIFRLFGTANDRPITDAVAAGLSVPVENLAGRTDLVTFGERLRECRLLVTNDTGGMHLANALGVPILGLFGPTNPQRTGPVFHAPVRLLQPPGCAPTGGGNLAALAPETVVSAATEMLANDP